MDARDPFDFESEVRKEAAGPAERKRNSTKNKNNANKGKKKKKKRKGARLVVTAPLKRSKGVKVTFSVPKKDESPLRKPWRHSSPAPSSLRARASRLPPPPPSRHRPLPPVPLPRPAAPGPLALEAPPCRSLATQTPPVTNQEQLQTDEDEDDDVHDDGVQAVRDAIDDEGTDMEEEEDEQALLVRALSACVEHRVLKRVEKKLRRFRRPTSGSKASRRHPHSGSGNGDDRPLRCMHFVGLDGSVGWKWLRK